MQKFRKIIHQSWKTYDIPRDVYPEIWQNSWKLVHPDWDYRLWSDEDNEDLVRDHYPQFLDFFLNLDVGIKRADFSRFLYMHQYGGVYVDLDFVCLKDLTPLIYGARIVVGRLSQNNTHYQIPNAFLASIAGEDFWMKVARDAMNAPPEEQGVERHAGPFRLQWALNKYQPEGLRILDQHLVYPLDWIHFTHWENGIHYRADEADLAWRMRSMDLASIQSEFPQSFAVTTWNHNW